MESRVMVIRFHFGENGEFVQDGFNHLDTVIEIANTQHATRLAKTIIPEKRGAWNLTTLLTDKSRRNYLYTYVYEEVQYYISVIRRGGSDYQNKKWVTNDHS